MAEKKLNGMTVAELIERLESCDPDARVVFAFDYGDRQHTEVVSCVDDVEEGAVVVWSDYHDRFRVADGEDAGEETPNVVVLR